MTSVFTILRASPLSGIAGGVFGSCRTLSTGPKVPYTLTTTPTSMLTVGGIVPGRGLLVPHNGIFGVIGRTKVRNHFPRPNELKRILRHGWKARMATLSGRKVLMRRILKGRHVISH